MAARSNRRFAHQQPLRGQVLRKSKPRRCLQCHRLRKARFRQTQLTHAGYLSGVKWLPLTAQSVRREPQFLHTIFRRTIGTVASASAQVFAAYRSQSAVVIVGPIAIKYFGCCYSVDGLSKREARPRAGSCGGQCAHPEASQLAGRLKLIAPPPCTLRRGRGRKSRVTSLPTDRGSRAQTAACQHHRRR
jgi:hypothetical protein